MNWYSLLHYAARSITPGQINLQSCVRLGSTQAKVQIWAAFSRVSTAAIHLRGKRASVRQVNSRGGANRWPAVKISAGMTGAFQEGAWAAIYRRQQMQCEKIARRGRHLSREEWTELYARHDQYMIE